jgi:hypothetical protein
MVFRQESANAEKAKGIRHSLQQHDCCRIESTAQLREEARCECDRGMGYAEQYSSSERMERLRR